MARTKQTGRNMSSRQERGLAGTPQLEAGSMPPPPLPDRTPRMVATSLAGWVAPGDHHRQGVPSPGRSVLNLPESHDGCGCVNRPSADDPLFQQQRKRKLAAITADSHARIRVNTLTYMLEVLQMRREDLVAGRDRGRSKAEVDETKLPREPAKEGPVFIHYTAREEEKSAKIVMKIEKLKSDLKAAEEKGEMERIEELQKRVERLTWLLEDDDEEEDTETDEDADFADGDVDFTDEDIILPDA